MELSPEVTKFARSRPVIECAQCGERLYIPEWSECLDGARVRHVWQCDVCGTSFETTVRFTATRSKGSRNTLTILRYRRRPRGRRLVVFSRNFAH